MIHLRHISKLGALCIPGLSGQNKEGQAKAGHQKPEGHRAHDMVSEDGEQRKPDGIGERAPGQGAMAKRAPKKLRNDTR